MEAITIPSPSAFLRSPVPAPAKPPDPPPPSKRKAAAKSSGPKKPADPSKPKQSKSRNGCITCKAKRLKCDETKPTCQQCQKRSVTCGGYKKDFKWRPFEEASFVNKATPQRVKREPTIKQLDADADADAPPPSPPASAPSSHTSTPEVATALPPSDIPVQDAFFHAGPSSPPSFSTASPVFLSNMLGSPPIPFDMQTPPFLREPAHGFDPTSATSHIFEVANTAVTMPGTHDVSRAGQSPRLIDLLLPGSELNARNPDLPQTIEEAQFGIPNDVAPEPLLDDGIEEVIRRPEPQLSAAESLLWIPSPGSSIFRSDPGPSPSALTRENTFTPIYRQPEVQAGSPEMLILRFDRQTCGILSVKDGPTENPWRTLVWPLARDSPALYHALASMTAFHTSKERPALRVDGMEHMRRSIRSLATGIEKMRVDTALATTLALAFSESWDQHISTGIEHLRGAKILLQEALTRHRKNALAGDDLARLKFLCNTWVYMDVIARLTSVSEDELVDFENVLLPVNAPFQNTTSEIDPLMGCAMTLFPLIGKAAALCRKTQRASSNSLSMISQAAELKHQIERWQPDAEFETPEDPTAEIRHALQTAEAYRYATLLYLHQAFPEIPCLSSAELAKKVLVCLVTVPLSSRLVIVQIYPLLAAGCEAVEPEDRALVMDRWQSMAQRMWIGNIDRCWEVVQEVWKRRDQYQAAKQDSKFSLMARQPALQVDSKRKLNDASPFLNYLDHSPIAGQSTKRQRVEAGNPLQHGKRRTSDVSVEELDPEYTVRGRLHWVGVMKEWQWEILLG